MQEHWLSCSAWGGKGLFGWEGFPNYHCSTCVAAAKVSDNSSRHQDSWVTIRTLVFFSLHLQWDQGYVSDATRRGCSSQTLHREAVAAAVAAVWAEGQVKLTGLNNHSSASDTWLAAADVGRKQLLTSFPPKKCPRLFSRSNQTTSAYLPYGYDCQILICPFAALTNAACHY